MFRKFCVVGIVLTISLVHTNCNSVKIESSLLSKMTRGEPCNIIIRMVNGTDDILKKLNEQTFKSRHERLTTVQNTLQNYAKDCHAFILPFLETLDCEYTSFWITNEIFVADASPELISVIARSQLVHEIHEEKIIKLEEPIVLKIGNNTEEVDASESDPLEGIKLIQAPAVWRQHNLTGRGVLVGHIDTGVHGSHKDLKDNFVGGDYGWFDPTKIKSIVPTDNTGHGTHTMGTIVGASGIGVAPGARWMSCRGCETSSCAQADLLSCGQFILCPTKTDGTAKNCSHAPHLVSNSWGAGQGETNFDSMIAAWKTAGIIPIFSNGNSGPTCKSANSPADSKEGVIAVGAIDFKDTLATFSSVGPTVLNTIKPDISAPGVDIESAWIDGGYATLSGTSMAAPHVAGVVALLLSQNHGLTFQDIESFLYSSTKKEGLIGNGEKCGGVENNTFPNNAFGNGRLNALGAIESALKRGKSQEKEDKGEYLNYLYTLFSTVHERIT